MKITAKKTPQKPLAGTKCSQFTVYLPRELDKEVRTLALQSGRKLSRMTEMLLLAGLKAYRDSGEEIF